MENTEGTTSRVGTTAARAAARAGLMGGCLALALLGTVPTPALAAEGNTGTTEVTVVADDSNLRFRVPTLIPFVAASDGTLTGPSPEATRIENQSAYGLKVTNVRISPTNGWSHTNEVGKADDSISWMVGPSGAEVDASGAASDTGTAITSPLWNMTYMSDDTETDDILLDTRGMVGRVAQDISSPVHVGTVTFTLAPGAHGTPAAGEE